MLGDKVTAIAEKAGVAAAVRAVERVTGWRCGCAKRREWLNNFGR